MTRTLPTLVVVFALITVPVASATATATDGGNAVASPEVHPQTSSPETAGEYLSTFQSLNGSEAYQNYSEFEVLRSQAVFAVQVGDFTDSEAQQMTLVLDILRTFRDAYRFQQNGSYQAALDAANNTSETSEQLRDMEGGEQYAVLTDVALERFYGETGQALQSLAEQQNSTPRRIRTLQQAAASYQRSGSADQQAQVLIRVDSTQTAYRADIEELNESAATASAFTDNCGDCGDLQTAITSYGLGVFPRYRQSLVASQETREAAGLATQHGLSSRSESLSTLRSEIDSRQSTLALASLALILAYVSVVGLFAAIVSRQLLSWRRDLSAATSGDSVLLGAMLDA